MNASGASIAWINRGAPGGCWGAPNALTLPADARGLLLAEGVFETVLVLGARPQLLAAHLQRWQNGAALLGLAPPPSEAQIDNLLRQAIARSGIDTGALRLNWCRGSAPRGLAPPEPVAQATAQRPAELFWLQLSAMAPAFDPVRVIVSPSEQRQATSLLSRCKSFGYGSALIARRQAHIAGADDALLASSAGGLCCSTAANLLIQSDTGWLTPPLSSGCLPGIMRQEAIACGLVQEAPISTADLLDSTGALLLNSLGCRPIRHADSTNIGPRATVNPADAKQVWRRLLVEAGASGPESGP